MAPTGSAPRQGILQPHSYSDCSGAQSPGNTRLQGGSLSPGGQCGVLHSEYEHNLPRAELNRVRRELGAIEIQLERVWREIDVASDTGDRDRIEDARRLRQALWKDKEQLRSQETLFLRLLFHAPGQQQEQHQHQHQLQENSFGHASKPSLVAPYSGSPTTPAPAPGGVVMGPPHMLPQSAVQQREFVAATRLLYASGGHSTPQQQHTTSSDDTSTPLGFISSSTTLGQQHPHHDHHQEAQKTTQGQQQKPGKGKAKWKGKGRKGRKALSGDEQETERSRRRVASKKEAAATAADAGTGTGTGMGTEGGEESPDGVPGANRDDSELSIGRRHCFESDFFNPSGYAVSRSSDCRIIDVWNEWKTGINGGPAIEALEEKRRKDKEGWWSNVNDYKYWSKQMRVVHAVEQKAEELGGDLEDSIRFWEDILQNEFEGSVSKLREALGGQKANEEDSGKFKRKCRDLLQKALVRKQVNERFEEGHASTAIIGTSPTLPILQAHGRMQGVDPAIDGDVGKGDCHDGNVHRDFPEGQHAHLQSQALPQLLDSADASQQEQAAHIAKHSSKEGICGV